MRRRGRRRCSPELVFSVSKEDHTIVICSPLLCLSYPVDASGIHQQGMNLLFGISIS